MTRESKYGKILPLLAYFISKKTFHFIIQIYLLTANIKTKFSNEFGQVLCNVFQYLDNNYNHKYRLSGLKSKMKKVNNIVLQLSLA